MSKEIPSLKGKVAIVSGAAQGIGLACAKLLHERGMRVLAFDTNPAIQNQDVLEPRVADVGRREDVESVIAQALQLGEIALLVNNAATWKITPVDSPWEQVLADWHFIMDTNLRGLLMLSRSVIPHLRANGFGHIINMSTYYVLPAKSPGTNNSQTDLYNASKWALNGFTDAWSKHLAPDNIMVNGMAMGAVATPMLANLFPKQTIPPAQATMLLKPEQIAQQMWDIIHSGRSGENFGAWVGEDVTLGTEPPGHQKITGLTQR
ncbi:MAG: SDR family oxidoreductase [Pseudomonadota bacterium]